jgi:hypothetical protein
MNFISCCRQQTKPGILTALGNITSKSDIGAYTYGPGTGCASNFAGPHAVSIVSGTKIANYCYDNDGNLTASDGRAVAWSALNLPVLIHQNLRSITITYGLDRARFKRVDQNETSTATTYYVPGAPTRSSPPAPRSRTRPTSAVVIETTSTPTASETI